jgi:glycosyltransferase involved in cell wall biosynthesis
MNSAAITIKPKVLVVGHFPPAAGGITSFLLTVLSSPIKEKYELVPFNIGRPAKLNVINNTGYGALINSGLKRALVALVTTVWHMVIFPFVVLFHKPVIIHIHTAQFLVFWETAYYVFVARAFRILCVLQFHASFRYFYQVSRPCLCVLMLWVLCKVNICLLISTEDLEFVREKTRRSIKCVYLPNFIEVDAFQEVVNQARKRFRRGKDIAVLFLGGSEAAHKGLFDLLRAICMLDRSLLGLRFLLIGVPREEVESRLPADLVKRCEIRGWVSGLTKIDIFARADIFVLPSYAEGMPISILEAMASSIPVIATKVGGIPDLITEGQEGYLLDPGDVEGLARAISTLACSHKTRKDMARNGLQKARHLYDVSTGVHMLQSLYEGMLLRRTMGGNSCGKE